MRDQIKRNQASAAVIPQIAGVISVYPDSGVLILLSADSRPGNAVPASWRIGLMPSQIGNRSLQMQHKILFGSVIPEFPEIVDPGPAVQDQRIRQGDRFQFNSIFHIQTVDCRG